eukprot:SAG31_NODE_10102_length_1182_cov_1.605725_2_plen_202_part_00
MQQCADALTHSFPTSAFQANQTAENLRIDRSQGRVKLQARWGPKGQWISFKASRDLTLSEVKTKLAAALHVELAELETMELQWRDANKTWWSVTGPDDLDEAMGPRRVKASSNGNSFELSEKELAQTLRTAGGDQLVLFQLLPRIPRPPVRVAKIVDFQEAMRKLKPNACHSRRLHWIPVASSHRRLLCPLSMCQRRCQTH